MVKKRVMVGMSGGVDSSVAALLLKKKGYEVIGVFMKNWTHEQDTKACPWEDDYKDMRMVCEQLEIPYYTFNFEQEYRDRVFAYFLKEYKTGRTPNPDVMCNTEIKFRVFLERAQELKADFIATGHYARTKKVGKTVHLLKGKDENKDQTYFIHHLAQDQLKRILFPIGHLPKPQVRQIAENAGLVVAKKPDSQGICFIGKVDFRDFLAQYIPKKSGNIQTVEGQVLGTHIGLPFYTIGQREGLGIGGTGPYFVVEKQIKTNTLIVAQGEHHPALFAKGLLAINVHWISGKEPKKLNMKAKIRYRTPDQSCKLVSTGKNSYKVYFTQAQRAIAPGQFVVFYSGQDCLGGGVIQKALT
ncbi:MAG: tRNA 2-thiouridine(34) synthase MnmA [Patescibacteria group bacterium]